MASLTESNEQVLTVKYWKDVILMQIEQFWCKYDCGTELVNLVCLYAGDPLPHTNHPCIHAYYHGSRKQEVKLHVYNFQTISFDNGIQRFCLKKTHCYKFILYTTGWWNYSNIICSIAYLNSCQIYLLTHIFSI